MDDRNPTSDRLRRLASRYEAGVGRGRAEHIASRAISRAGARSSTGRRVAVAVSSGAFVLVSLTGVGVAADRSVPGDFLHPLDRALEALGLSSDLVEERLQEAIALAERGEMALAVATANEALVELDRRGVPSTVPIPMTTEIAADTVAVEASTTTTEETVTETTVSTEDEAPAEPEQPAVTTEPAAEPVDAGETLRLAAEQLLQSVRSAKTDPTASDDVTTAASFLAEATASVVSEPDEITPTSTTSTSSTTSTTTTTAPPTDGNDSDTGTTTTTVASEPDDGSGSDDPGDDVDDPPGPIFLPSP